VHNTIEERDRNSVPSPKLYSQVLVLGNLRRLWQHLEKLFRALETAARLHLHTSSSHRHHVTHRYAAESLPASCETEGSLCAWQSIQVNRSHAGAMNLCCQGLVFRVVIAGSSICGVVWR